MSNTWRIATEDTDGGSFDNTNAYDALFQTSGTSQAFHFGFGEQGGDSAVVITHEGIQVASSLVVEGNSRFAGGVTFENPVSIGNIPNVEELLSNVASGEAIQDSNILPRHIAGQVPVPQGGTGRGSFGYGNILLGNGTDDINSYDSFKYDSGFLHTPYIDVARRADLQKGAVFGEPNSTRYRMFVDNSNNLALNLIDAAGNEFPFANMTELHHVLRVLSVNAGIASSLPLLLTSPPNVYEGPQSGVNPILGTTQLTVRMFADISLADSGVLFKAGGDSTGSIVYVHDRRVWAQAGDADGVGPSANRFELSYTLDSNLTNVEVVFTASTAIGARLFVGEILREATYAPISAANLSDASEIAFGGSAGQTASNRGEFDGTNAYTGSVSRLDVWPQYATT